jgi:geranylgeranyl reductase family protein
MRCEVAIVGGGPAGAYCALELAKRGIFATIFDASHPREKVCGGGISSLALEKFPFLEQYRPQGCSSAALKLISCTNNREVVVEYRGFNLSRQYFDEQLINLAVNSGARWVKEKVLALEKKQNFWKIKTENQVLTAKILVGADGINSIVRRATIGRILSENLGLGYGYIFTGLEDGPNIVKYVADKIPGYIWIFPHLNYSHIGIGSQLKYSGKFKTILDDFIHSYCPQIKVISKFAAMLPWVSNPEFYELPCAGDNWILVGDAAGHADPSTGEGILYALWSGKLAAEAIAKNSLCLYDKLWREQYGNFFVTRCKGKSKYYDPFLIDFSIAVRSLKSSS